MTEYNYLLDPVVGDPLKFQLAENKTKPRKWRNKATAQVCNLTGEPLWVRYLGQNGTTVPVIDPNDITKTWVYPVRTPIDYKKEAKFYDTAQNDISGGKIAFIDNSEDPKPNTQTTASLVTQICSLDIDKENSTITLKTLSNGTVYPVVGSTDAVDLNGASLMALEASLSIKANTYVDTDYALVPVYFSGEFTQEVFDSWVKSIEDYAFVNPADQEVTAATATTSFFVKPEALQRSSATKDNEYFIINLKSYWLSTATPNYCVLVARHNTGSGNPELAYAFTPDYWEMPEAIADDTDVSVYLLDKTFDSTITATGSCTPNCYIATGDWLTELNPIVNDAKVVVDGTSLTVTYPVLKTQDYRVSYTENNESFVIDTNDPVSYTDGSYTGTLDAGDHTLSFSYTIGETSGTATKDISIS